MSAEPVSGPRSELDAETLRRRWRVPRVLLYARVGSTNDVARRVAEEGAKPGTVVIAGSQTAGRGRLGRPWHDTPGASLLLSMLMHAETSAELATMGALPLRVGLACALAVERAAGVAVGIKWPNDLLIGDRKVGGILCESAFGAQRGFVVAGVGINVAQSMEQIPRELHDMATSLSIVTGREIRPDDVADEVVPALYRFVSRPLAPLSDDEIGELVRRDACAGRPLCVTLSEREPHRHGTGAGFERDGRLRLRLDDGEITRVAAGTVRFATATLTPGRRA